MSKLDGGWGWGGDKSILQFVHVQAGEHVKEKTLLWIRMGEGRGWGSWASRSPWYGRRKGETKPCLRSDSLQHDRARLKGELLKGELGEVWRLPRMWGDSAPPPMFIFPEFRLPPRHAYRIDRFRKKTFIYFAMRSSSPWELRATATRALARWPCYVGSSDRRIWGITWASCGHQTRSAQTGWLQWAEILLLLFRWPQTQTLGRHQGLLPSIGLCPGCPISFLCALAFSESRCVNSSACSSVMPIIVTGNAPFIFLFFIKWHQLLNLGPSRFQYGLILTNYICRDHISEKCHILRFPGNLNFRDTLFKPLQMLSAAG